VTRPRRAIRRSRPTPTMLIRSAQAKVTAYATDVSHLVRGSIRLVARDGQPRRDLVRTGLAALAITALGLGTAGAVAATSSATSNADTVGAVSATDHPAFGRRDQSASRDAGRPDASSAERKRATDLSEARAKVSQAQRDAAINERARELAGASTDTTEAAQKMKAAAQKTQDAAQKTQDEQGKKVVPLASYRIAAQFGAVGAWARYHTGVDFSAALGTPIHSAAVGVVTHAGTGGEAGGWAGSYVVVRHEDGYATLYAHMSPAPSVAVGQKVGPGDLLGHVGLTGRTFGPHCHIELYPPGATPGDVYAAINLFPWLNAS